MRKPSLVTCTDSYKFSHYLQYPANLRNVYSYIESRGGEYDFTLFFGLQAYVQEYLTTPITRQDIDAGEARLARHIPGLQFNRAGWEYILEKHNGYLPLRIRAVREGSRVPVSNALVTVENTDEQVPWLAGYIESHLLRGVWYPTTAATRSRTLKDIAAHYLRMTSDYPEQALPFSVHDFGMRGASSRESAGIAGGAHLVNFAGTDNGDALDWVEEYYRDNAAGFSIPASEHSVATMYGRDGEEEYFRMMLRQFGKPGRIYANVADSYDIYHACKIVLPRLKDDLAASGATMVVRPDSGDPVEVVGKTLHLLEEEFGYTVNSKGYKVLNNVKVIQGDGINALTVEALCKAVIARGFSTDNLAFGCGGYLLQMFNRDTQKFAMKASAARMGDTWTEIIKDPVTDPNKRSKPGRVTLYKNADGEYYTSAQLDTQTRGRDEQLEDVFVNGRLVREQSFQEIRELSGK